EQAGDDASLIDHNFVFKSDIEITDAKMELTMTYDTQAPALDNLVDFDIHTTVEDLEATYFSGIVQYKLEGDALNIDPVSLSDIPDFLSNEETDLRLANPQIYLGLNNPMAVYNLKVETGLELASVRGEEKTPFNLNAGELVKIGTNYGVNGPYNFVLSPSMPQQPLPAYAEHLTHVGFSSLSNVLAGNGLPESIEINLVNPELPEQPVSRFELNNSISGVKGTYEFLAPLALKTGENGSVIVYSKVDDGWSDDDLDKLTINTLSIDADVDSNLPLNANLTVYPIDKQGNVISNVKVTTATIAANTSGQKLSLALTGEIKELDGVKYEAVVRPGSEEALSPNQTLTLTNIRVKVSGYYLTDFD
ncbi:MAG: hypothetical protein K2H76_02650, partial [Muribaculaceae bacterium]|nr:hypothetical protein [Muribaculaceae bacterium]